MESVFLSRNNSNSLGWFTMAVFGWLVAVVDFFERKVPLADVGWLVLVLCEREILLAGCNEDEAKRVNNIWALMY